MEKENCTNELPKSFTESGQRDDEVTLVFKDKQELYVSRNFLAYASPVFEAMFSHDFTEKQENKVNLMSKKYEHFLEFLLCLHPRILKEVNESNVLRIIPIAEEYQVQSIVSKSKIIIKSMLDKIANSAYEKENLYRIPALRACLRILEIVNMLNYEEEITYSVSTVATFGYDLLFEGRSLNRERLLDTKVYNKTLRDLRNECNAIFERFPAELRCRILKERLRLIDDNRFSMEVKKSK